MLFEPKFTPEEQRTIANRYRNGNETVVAIAAELGVQRQTVTEILRRHGVAIRHGALPPSQYKSIVERYRKGESARSIAADFDVDHKTVLSFVNSMGVPSKPKGRQRQFATRQEWRESPSYRIRNLLNHDRDRAKQGNIPFDDALIEHYAENPPKFCGTCGTTFDYAIKHRGERLGANAPALERLDDSLGYTVVNTTVTCRGCKRVKDEISDEDIERIIALAKRTGKVNV